MTNGVFIVVDGIDGCGKTTVAEHLTHELKGNYIKALGQGVISSAVRERFMCPTSPQDNIDAAIWMTASLRETYSDYIKPMLSAGKILIVDRWVSSLFAYQLYPKTDECPTLRTINALVTGHGERSLFPVPPDLYIWCDTDQETASSRIKKRNECDRMDILDRYKKDIIHRGFEQYYATNVDKKAMLDTSADITTTVTNALSLVHENILNISKRITS
jgi:dTMP kinase